MSDEESIDEEIEYDEYSFEEEFESYQSSTALPSSAAMVKSSATVSDPLPVRKQIQENYEKDNDEDALYYSEDFETSVAANVNISKVEIGPGQHQRINDNESINQGRPFALPSTSLQALQAEIALDDLSREVIRLREEQRRALRDRKAQISMKRDRANKRRQDYQKELDECKNKATRLQLENTSLHQLLEETRLKLSVAEEKIESMESMLRITAEQTGRREKNLIDLDAKCSELESSLELSREQWRHEKERLVDENIRTNLLLAVLQRNTEMNEERLRRDRENLPQHYKNILEEELKRLSVRDSLLSERMALARIEEEKRLAAVERLREECVRELDGGRLRLERECAETRESLLKQLSSFSKEKAEQEQKFRGLTSELELERVSLANKENEIAAREASLRQREVEIEVHLHALEPGLRSAERERQIAINTIEMSEKKLSALIERESRLLDAERGFRARESSAEETMDLAIELKTSLAQAGMQMRRDKERLESEKMGVKAERFRLHSCAMEMSRQMLVIKQSLGYMLRQQRSDSIDRYNHTGLNTLKGHHHMNAKVVDDNMDPIFANIVYALNSASGSLVSLAHNLIDPKDIHLELPNTTMFSSELPTETANQINPPLTEGIESNFINENVLLNQGNRPLASTEALSNEIRMHTSKSAEFEDASVENCIFAASESVQAVRNIALKYISSN